MTNRKNIRQKGKILLSVYFKKFKKGDTVSFVDEKSVPFSFPNRMIGRTAKVIGSRGRSQIVELKDGSITKQYVIHPIHLKKLK